MAWDKREYRRQYYLKNKEQIKAKAMAHYEANREKCIERASKLNKTPEYKARLRKYRRSNAAKLVEKTNEWRRNNPEKFTENSRRYVNNRRARLLNAPGVFSNDAWLRKVAFHGWRCLYCRKGLTFKNLTMDHRIPLSAGGTNWLSNLVPACKPCNSRKSARRDFSPHTVQHES